MVSRMKYENFYHRCTDYNFMLKDAVHFGVYSECRMQNAQDELDELLKMMSCDSGYAQYKPLLEEMYQAAAEMISADSFLPPADCRERSGQRSLSARSHCICCVYPHWS